MDDGDDGFRSMSAIDHERRDDDDDDDDVAVAGR